MARRSREMRIREFLAAPPFGRRNISEKEIELFGTALTHDSYSNEEHSRGREVISNERLEFLGDAVMELIVCEYIYSNTGLKEGAMTDFKKDTVCNMNLSNRIRRSGIDIDDSLLVGEGQKDKRTGSNIIKDSMRADAFEAVLGAIYLLYGMDEARRIVNEIFLK